MPSTLTPVDTISGSEMSNLSLKDTELLASIARSLGPSIYLSTSGSELFAKEELEEIKKNLLFKRLGIKYSDDIIIQFDQLLKDFTTSTNSKSRALFYLTLVKAFNKEHLFISNDNKELVEFGTHFIEKQQDLDGEIATIIDRNFFNLI